MRVRLLRLRAVIGGLALLCAPHPADAQQVGARQYTSEDNLADNFIDAIHQDSRGYIWFATRDGLSRFDGYAFTTYRQSDGLPHSRIYDVVEDRPGTLWVATREGLAHLVENAAGKSSRFAKVNSIPLDLARPGAMIAHPDRAIWALTRGGIARGIGDGSGALDLRRVTPKTSGPADPRVFRDRDGRIWAMLDRELLVLSAEGEELARYGVEHGVGRQWIVSVAQNRAGRMFAANQRELFELIPGADLRSSRWQKIPMDLRGAANQMRWLAFDASDRLWIGATQSVMWRRDGVVTELSLSPGAIAWVETGLVDKEGNVWLGTHGQGVFRIPSEPIVSFNERHGMPAGVVVNLAVSSDGRVFAATNSGGLVELAHGKAIASPGATLPAFAEVEHRVAIDASGSWWIGTRTGELYWLPRGRPDYTRARLVWKAPAYPLDGIWVGPHLGSMSDGTVFVGGPKSQVFRAFTDGDRPQLEPLPQLEKDNVTSATLDRQGNLWLAGLGRLGRSANGVVEVIAPPADIPRDARPHVPFVDSRGWLWVAFREQGVSVTREPAAAVPRFDTYSTASGLSSDAIRSIAEDRLGRLYFGSARGLDRLDTSTGVIRRFGIHEGLAGATVWSLISDHRGRIWVGTSGGVSLIDVDAAAPPPAMPPAYLTRVRIAGEEQTLPERGATGLPQLTLASDKNNLVLDWVAVTQASDVPLRYQYRLAGFDRGWSAPTSSRSVTYAGLGAGTYRFEVRALVAGRTDGGEAAVLPFTVVAPIWRRPWFAAVVGLLVALTASWYHRLRLRQALAMERLRQQVALDLHDDVGSGLSEIAILSELAREEGSRAPAWADIAGRARSLRESMGDIVWAVDPRHDSLGELVQRMRQIAHNLLEAQGLHVDFTAPDADSLSAIDMAPDRRRNILLIFKEAVHNVAKHAGARRVRISIALEPRRLILSIDDDGRGFDQEAPRGGHGLSSLRRRADMIGGALKMQSRPGAGTRVALRVPLG